MSSPVQKNNVVVRWFGIGVLCIGFYTGAILYISSVSAKTDDACARTRENRERIEEVYSQIVNLKDAMHRVEKRQVLIMSKLGIKDTRLASTGDNDG